MRNGVDAVGLRSAIDKGCIKSKRRITSGSASCATMKSLSKHDPAAIERKDKYTKECQVVRNGDSRKQKRYLVRSHPIMVCLMGKFGIF